MKIWKFEIPPQDEFTLQLPKHAKILSFQEQHHRLYIWCLTNQEDTEPIHFKLVGTGHAFDYEDSLYMRFIGTAQMANGNLVWHLFQFQK